jgi:hypothetical protein
MEINLSLRMLLSLDFDWCFDMPSSSDISLYLEMLWSKEIGLCFVICLSFEPNLCLGIFSSINADLYLRLFSSTDVGLYLWMFGNIQQWLDQLFRCTHLDNRTRPMFLSCLELPILASSGLFSQHHEFEMKLHFLDISAVLASVFTLLVTHQTASSMPWSSVNDLALSCGCNIL